MTSDSKGEANTGSGMWLTEDGGGVLQMVFAADVYQLSDPSRNNAGESHTCKERSGGNGQYTGQEISRPPVATSSRG